MFGKGLVQLGQVLFCVVALISSPAWHAGIGNIGAGIGSLAERIGTMESGIGIITASIGIMGELIGFATQFNCCKG